MILNFWLFEPFKHISLQILSESTRMQTFCSQKEKRVFTKKEAHNSQENRVIGSVECQAASPFSYSNTAVKGS